jgi:hypothetical protein
MTGCPQRVITGTSRSGCVSTDDRTTVRRRPSRARPERRIGLPVRSSGPPPDQHEPQEPPAADSEVPQPHSTDPTDLDAALSGMSVLLRVALRLMRSYPARRGRGLGRTS